MPGYTGPVAGGRPSSNPYKPKKLRAPKPRFGATQKVSGAAAQRAGARLARTGPVKGVDGTDGYNGREIRLAREARAKQKDSRTLAGTTQPVNRAAAESDVQQRKAALVGQLAAAGKTKRKVY